MNVVADSVPYSGRKTPTATDKRMTDGYRVTPLRALTAAALYPPSAAPLSVLTCALTTRARAPTARTSMMCGVTYGPHSVIQRLYAHMDLL